MINYINQQQETCLNILKNRKLLLQTFIEKMKNKDVQDLNFIATGSSKNAISSVRFYLERVCNREVRIFEPSEFIFYTRFFNKESLFFVISQSGKSASSLDALNKLQKQGIQNVFGITSDPSKMPIDKNYVIDIGCGEELVGFVTKGFTSTMLILMLIGLEYALANNIISTDKYNEEITTLENTVSLMNETIEKSTLWYNKNKKNLIESHRYNIIGCGDYMGTANEAETKFTETIRVPTSSHEVEEYMHGPYLELAHGYSLFFIEAHTVLLNRIKELEEYIEKQGVFCYSITQDAQDKNPSTLILPIASVDTSMLLYVIPFQIMSYYLSKDKGIDIDKKIFEDFDDILKSKV